MDVWISLDSDIANFYFKYTLELLELLFSYTNFRFFYFINWFSNNTVHVFIYVNWSFKTLNTTLLPLPSNKINICNKYLILIHLWEIVINWVDGMSTQGVDSEKGNTWRRDVGCSVSCKINSKHLVIKSWEHKICILLTSISHSHQCPFSNSP